MKFFNQPVKNKLTRYDNIRKIATGQGDEYTTGCFINYKMIAIDLSKQQALDANPKAIQQNSVTANLNQPGNTTFFIIEETKETILDFSQGTVTVLQFYFVFIKNQYKMTQYNTINVKFPNQQINKLKSGIKNGTEVTLKLSLNAIGDDCNNDNNFLHKLLLTNTKVSRLCKAFANGSSANIKLSKTQFHKIGQSEVF